MSAGATTLRAQQTDFVETLLVGTAKVVGLLAWWAVRFPLASTPIVVALAATVLAGWRLGVVVAVVCAVSYGLWCYLDRESFHRVLWYPIRESLAHLVAIQTLLGACVHAASPDRAASTTAHWSRWLQSVTIGATSDVLAVRIVTGQCVADWQKRSDALAEAWRAQRVTIALD